MSRRSPHWLLPIVTVLMLAAPRPAAAIVYRGLTHTPLGGTTLALSDTLLLVSGMGPSGSDGVSITLPAGCTNFAALFDSVQVSTNGIFNANFFNGANVAAFASVQKLPSDSTELFAGFDGLSDTSSVRVSAYLGGSLVRSIVVQPTSGVPPPAPGQRYQTDIIPLIILGCVVVGILSDVREDHVHLPSDPPGIYSAETHYTFIGYGLASHPAHGHLWADAPIVSFDELVISPVTKFSSPNGITAASLTGHDVAGFKIGQEFVTRPPVILPGLRGAGVWVAIGLLMAAGLWSLVRRRLPDRPGDPVG